MRERDITCRQCNSKNITIIKNVYLGDYSTSYFKCKECESQGELEFHKVINNKNI
jgi:transposase-like protein